jgi:hypothetical protein
MYDVNCSSCGRRTAIAPNKAARGHRQFCSSWCAAAQPITPTEERTDQLSALNLIYGVTPVHAARLYGMPHAQAYKALDRIDGRWK